ncbi:MAG: DNA-3-methyladenine glycosylase 2 [Alphaproteobacteria bacterium]
MEPIAPHLDPDQCYAAHSARDPRADGQFFTAVTSTGIFCRTICPARTPKRENCQFVPTAAAAIALGYRPCLRCRPETAPGTGAWLGTVAVVQRGMRLIEQGALDQGGSVQDLAHKLGLTSRHLRRLFEQHLGAPPKAIALARRLELARRLIRETSLTMTDIALASGFSSSRRFNDAFRRSYGNPPSSLRRSSRNTSSSPDPSGALTLTLRASPPFDATGTLRWFASRAAGAHEHLREDGSYARLYRIGDAIAACEITPLPDQAGLSIAVRSTDLSILPRLTALINWQFGLGFIATHRNDHLSQDPILRPMIDQRPGLRLPASPDPVEAAARAILGQQVSVKAARTLCIRLVEQFGMPVEQPLWLDAETPARLFPDAATLAEAPIEQIGVPGRRAETFRRLMSALATGDIKLDHAVPIAELRAQLLDLKGIGPWTADYICLRALGESDAFPSGDLGLVRGSIALGGPETAKALDAYAAEHWSPYRAHAALYLWAASNTPL